MRDRVPESNFRYLFAGLVMLLVAEPIFDVLLGSSSDRVFGILLAGVVLAGVWSLSPSRLWLRVGRALAALGIALAIAGAVWPATSLQTATWLVAILFFLMSSRLGLQVVLAGGRITTNHLFGAMSVYLLLGVTWALVFGALHRLAPGSFEGLSTASPSEFLYFSFVTLATLGYGDITPVHPIARTVVYLEAVVGQLYVAVLIASLVSRHVVSQEQD
jgi:hypothetical protein